MVDYYESELHVFVINFVSEVKFGSKQMCQFMKEGLIKNGSDGRQACCTVGMFIWGMFQVIAALILVSVWFGMSCSPKTLP